MAVSPAMLIAVVAMVLSTASLSGNVAASELDARLSAAGAEINRTLESWQVPGLVFGITDRRELRKVIVHGYADLKTRKPLTADSRFAIGSVSKAFTSIALMQLAQEGRFDPHAPVSRYLPSLQVPSKFAPVTGHDLMSHTSGLPNYLPDSASSRYAIAQMREFTPVYAPGEHFWYSNTGYQLLGYVLEDIDHGAYRRILQRRVLEPLGMKATSPVIDDSERTRMVVSYLRWPADGSYVEAPWFEYTAGDGSVVSNVADMCAYMRFYLNRGAGPNGAVLSESSFATLTTPVLDEYGYGMWMRRVNDHTVITHSGGIAGFHSLVEVHMDEGFGLVFLSNSAVPKELKDWMVGAISAAYNGNPLPVPPVSSGGRRDLHEYAGQYRLGGNGTAGAGGALEFAVVNDHLSLKTSDGVILLEKLGADTFVAPGGVAGVFPFVFGRSESDQSKVVEVSQGARWYVTEGFSEVVRPAVPKEYDAFVGHFVYSGPEGPVARVFVRNGQLVVLGSLQQGATPELLEPIGEGVFRAGKMEFSPERVRFDTLVDGHAQRLMMSGVPLYRRDTP